MGGPLKSSLIASLSALFFVSTPALACQDHAHAGTTSHTTTKAEAAKPAAASAKTSGKVATPAQRTFGATLTLKEAQPLETALASARTTGIAKAPEVLVKGEVKKVCEKKGCWLEVADGSTSLRMTFKDYGFFMPKEILGKRVIAQGRFEEKTESVDQQKHWLEDGKASKEEIAAVNEPKTVTNFIASGVELAD